MFPSAIVVVCLLSMTVLLTGCAKKPAKSAPPPPAPVETPAPQVAQSEPEVAPEPVANPLDGDLGALNAYIDAQGLIGDVYYDYDRDELREEARARPRTNANS